MNADRGKRSLGRFYAGAWHAMYDARRDDTPPMRGFGRIRSAWDATTWVIYDWRKWGWYVRSQIKGGVRWTPLSRARRVR